MNEKRYWFRRKRFGWGLEPGSVEGWIVTILFLIVDAGGTFALMPVLVRNAPSLLVVWAFGWLALYIAVVVAKGEPLW